MASPRITALTAAGAMVAAAYPILVFIALRKGVEPRWLALGLVALVALRWGRPLLRKAPKPLAAAVAIAALALAWFRGSASVMWYPVGVNLAFLFVFASSLRFPPTVIERLARLRHPDLDERGVRYTRKVTLVWCGFFACNGLAAAAIARIGDAGMWTFYNGFLAYLLMGTLFLGEWIVRRNVMAAGRT